MEYSPKKMQEKMNENNFGFKKKFGQNFIIDENIINGIVTKAEIDDETLVIEIGPGAGSLTNGIAKKAKNVLCYEIDTTLENMLKDNLKEYNNIEIISVDELFNEATTLYVLFCKCLPKFRTVNNKKYNLQIAITKEYVKMGYPAIFDSF